MKKHFLACLLALPALAASRQEASAWCKFNLGVGANIGYSSGGSKSFLWGAFQSSDFNAVNPQSMYPPMPGLGHGQALPGGCCGQPGAFAGGFNGAFGDALNNGPFPPTTPETGPPPGTATEAAPVKPAQYPATYPNGDAMPVGYYYYQPYAPYPYYPDAGYWYGN